MIDKIPDSMLAGPTVVPYSTVIPLDTAAFGKKMPETQLTANSVFSVAANPIEEGNCTLCLIGDGSSIPNLSAFTAGNAYTYSPTLHARNIYVVVWEFSTPLIYGSLGTPASVPVAPTLISATVSSATPSRMDLVWSSAVNLTISAPSAFSATGGHPVIAHTYDGGVSTHLDLSAPYVFGAAASFLSYDKTAGVPMTGTNGLQVASFGSFPVTNNTTSSARQVILDMDYMTDAGDSGQAQTALMAHMLGYHKIIGVILGTTGTENCGAFDALRKWYGVPSIPMGVWKGTAKDGSNTSWVDGVYVHFDRDVALASTITDSTVQYRTLLANASGRVDIIAGGYANCLDALLSSAADGISPLTGAQLIATKVNMLWWSAGEYPTSGTPEFNMQGGSSTDATFSAMSNRVVTNWPSPITYAGFLYGQSPTLDGVTLHAKNILDPRRQAFDIFNGGINNGGWDEQLVVLSLDQTGNAFVQGGNTAVSTSTGCNTWVNNAGGKDRYAVKTQVSAWYKDHVEALSCLDPSSTLPVPNWGTSPAISPAATWPPVLPPLDIVPTGEKLTNGTFNNNSLTGWTGDTATLTAVNGRLNVVATGDFPIAYTPFTTVNGQVYTVTLKFTASLAPINGVYPIAIFIKNGATDAAATNGTLAGTLSNATASNGTLTGTFTASGTTSTLMVIMNQSGTAAFGFTVSFASVV